MRIFVSTMNAIMPSKRAQLNVRMDDATKAEFERLQKDLSEKLGLELSQADVIKLAIRALSRENPPAPKKAK